MVTNGQAKNLNRACNELAELTLDALRSVVSITCGCMVNIWRMDEFGSVQGVDAALSGGRQAQRSKWASQSH